MDRKEPKDTELYTWTSHVKMKMRYYGLSEQRVKNVIRRPQRTEEGIAQKTVAVMQPQSLRRDKETGKKTWKAEIWVMYQLKAESQKKIDIDVPEALAGIFAPRKKVKIISAWRYPGITKEGEGLPEAILDEIFEAL